MNLKPSNLGANLPFSTPEFMDFTRSAHGEDVTAGGAEAEEERAMEEAVTTVAIRVEVAFISAAAYSLKIAVDLRDGGNPTNPRRRISTSIFALPNQASLADII